MRAQPELVLLSAVQNVAAAARGTQPAATDAPCTCGHPKAGHEHYRPGADCGTCGRDVCRAYTPARARLAVIAEAVVTAWWAVRIAVAIWRRM